MNRRKNPSYDFKIIIKSDTIMENGRLVVSVRNRITNEPIAFSSVSVYLLSIIGLYGEFGEANLITRYITDEEGKIPVISLPAIERSSVLQYYMTVNHFRYHPVNLMNIQIYPNVTTEYKVLLTPLTTVSPDYTFIITPEFF
ncbi:MAG: hypothetical protein GX339_08795 [Tissierellia bacterium]|nr:hypothetical protein [Tissierellia bacterium]